jgi:hypothetical protein
MLMLLVEMTQCHLVLVATLKRLRIYCEHVVVLYAFVVVSSVYLQFFILCGRLPGRVLIGCSILVSFAC